jgi:hypothetical protein
MHSTLSCTAARTPPLIHRIELSIGVHDQIDHIDLCVAFGRLALNGP